MLLSSAAIIGGLILLVWSADRFVLGASAVAHNYGVSPLLIGMVIMGFGTSAPEIFVGATAALNGNSGIAVGNAIGSNIANIALVLGIAALIAPLSVDSKVLKREFPVLLGITAFTLILLWDLQLSQWDGLMLIAATVGMLIWMFRMSKQPAVEGGGVKDISVTEKDSFENEFESGLPKDMSTGIAIFWTVSGLILLVASANILVWGAIDIAKLFGISDLVIGLTIIAVGTSLPEVAVAITAALKKEHEIVLGNVIGSNMFNLLAVLGVAAVITDSQLAPVVLSRDYAVMAALTITMFVMAYGFRKKGRINRWEASILILSYVGYMVWLYQSEIA